MLTKEKLTAAQQIKKPLVVDVPALGESVSLRYPTFSEWHNIVSEVRGREGKDPTAEMIARTISVCLANEDGTRMLTEAESQTLLEQDAVKVMALYSKCWETVLAGEGKVEQAEKN